MVNFEGSRLVIQIKVLSKPFHGRQGSSTHKTSNDSGRVLDKHEELCPHRRRGNGLKPFGQCRVLRQRLERGGYRVTNGFDLGFT
jgi:hypothetical protein